VKRLFTYLCPWSGRCHIRAGLSEQWPPIGTVARKHHRGTGLLQPCWCLWCHTSETRVCYITEAANRRALLCFISRDSWWGLVGEAVLQPMSALQSLPTLWGEPLPKLQSWEERLFALKEWSWSQGQMSFFVSHGLARFCGASLTHLSFHPKDSTCMIFKTLTCGKTGWFPVPQWHSLLSWPPLWDQWRIL
jgi:hypothetical protein